MKIFFYKGSDVIKESNTNSCVLPVTGCTVTIDMNKYLVENIHFNYDNGIILIDLK